MAMATRVTTARQAVMFFYKDAPELLKLTDGVVARLGGAWNHTQGQSPASRLLALMGAAESEAEAHVRATRLAVPCKAGCDHCCHFQEILVSTTEAVLVVRHIERHMSAAQRAAAVAAIRASGTTGDRRDTPCALLHDGRCSVYASRPMACRSYVSLSEPSCRSYRGNAGPLPPTFRQPVVVDAAVREVSRVFRHTRNFEINALLRRIYADPDKPALWADERPSEEQDIAKA
jgi:Fe-S-cluster containining protein